MPFARARALRGSRRRGATAFVGVVAGSLFAGGAAAAGDADPRSAGQIAATERAELALGGEVDARQFEYRNGISPSAYKNAFLAPAATLSGALFPFPARSGVLRDIGLTADYGMVFASGAIDANPMFYSAGLAARVHPGVDPRVILTVSLAYAFASFGAAGPATAELPAVSYRTVRPAIDARWQIGDFAVVGGTALRIVVDPSHISNEFYHPRGLGLDAHAGFALMPLRRLEVRLVASYQLFSFGFRAPSGSFFDSGGAIDLRYGASLSVARAF